MLCMEIASSPVVEIVFPLVHADAVPVRRKRSRQEGNRNCYNQWSKRTGGVPLSAPESIDIATSRVEAGVTRTQLAMGRRMLPNAAEGLFAVANHNGLDGKSLLGYSVSVVSKSRQINETPF